MQNLWDFLDGDSPSSDPSMVESGYSSSTQESPQSQGIGVPLPDLRENLSFDAFSDSELQRGVPQHFLELDEELQMLESPQNLPMATPPPAPQTTMVTPPLPPQTTMATPSIVVPSEETYQLLASEDMQQCFVQQQQQQQLQLPPEADSLPPTSYQHNHQGEVVVPVYRSPSQQPPMVLAQQQQQSIASMKGGMVEIPNLNDALGEFDFTVTVEEKERTTKSPMWLMSSITNKLYTNMNKAVPFEIHLKKKLPAGKFFVRAAAVFSSAQFLRSNVTRCPNHASISDVTNHDFPYPNHVIRADHPEAKYEESSTGRLSVVVPLDILVDGSDYTPILLRFMCLGSCVGGINRRPISILLTLEDGAGHPCGRKVIDVRVCACPTRDIRTDEQTLLNKGKKRRGNSMPDKPTAPIRKKPKMIDPKVEPQDDDDTLLYLPVRGRKLYDFLKATKETYLKMHPEYAAKYPDDLGYQNEEDSEDDGKNNLTHLLDVADSDSVLWDTGRNFSHQGRRGDGGGGGSKYDHHEDTLNGPKMSSPLSKLVPNITISPSLPMRLWHEETDGHMMHEENHSTVIKHSVRGGFDPNPEEVTSSSISDSVPTPRSSPMRTTESISKHVPVMQVQSYQPGSVAVKAKPHSIPKLFLTTNNANEGKTKRVSVHKSIENLSHPSFEPPDNSSQQGCAEQYLTPGSPEMIAANVLIEGFKGKAAFKSKSVAK